MANVSSFSGAMPVIPGGLVEVARTSRTSTYTIDQTSLTTASKLFSDLTFVADGGTYLVEFFCPQITSGSTASSEVNVYLTNSTPAAVARFGDVYPASTGEAGFYGRYYYTPSAGSVTINVCAIRGVSNGQANGGSAGTGYTPMYLSVNKIVNQNDGLKPFWTPPVVTSLPSQATEGDQVLLYSSSPYAGYQTHQYVTGSWRTLDDSRGTGAWQSWTPTWNGSLTVGNATVTALYMQTGKTVFGRGSVVWGSTTSATGALEMNLPVTPSTSVYASGFQYGQFYIEDASAGATYIGGVEYFGASKVHFPAWKADSTWVARSQVSSTSPFTWAVNDVLRFSFMYEAA